MSDEYGSQGFGKQGSLVNETARDEQTERELTYKYSNYPPLNDTTQSGGYSADERVWERDGQKGRLPQNGLIDQSLDGGDLKHELQDAKQGKDVGTRPKTDNFVGEGPSYETRNEAQRMVDQQVKEKLD
ncbi:uncharacterized protein SCHCODRAFT_02639446 [Schizophyllum commune H4-8]|uniref:Uncharacterized protein n=1 Tax=Schizophyllum commune (strain H4-8 / FGSC 9210) TaxID=578458 RepID=D8QGC3_SCHCM|nr:uncharacterized protein SCHCODRAFT_02639446 [Schizophyllum commune H4-8]KAI5887990.1 hypothetical protein SCHCODRAFT_02639446 [Schizophyllum commune H4-8]